MANESLMMTLAKVLIATAWVDGEISPGESRAVKQLLLNLPDKLTAQQWAVLDMYFESPVNDAERQRLIADLQAQISSEEDKQTVTTALKTLITADDTITQDEKVVAAEINAALDSVRDGVLGSMSRVLKRMLQQHTIATGKAPNRETHFEDFIKNKVYYNVQRRLEQEDEILNISDDQLRKLSLAGGVMARIARAQGDITTEEQEIIVDTIQRGWKLTHAEALLVTEVALSDEVVTMDRFHLTNELLKVATVEELTHFLEVLFTIANADGNATSDEIEEIRGLARAFNVPDKYFIAAKRKTKGT